MNIFKKEEYKTITRKHDDRAPKRHLEISIMKPESNQLLSAKKLTLRDRFLNTIFGNGRSLVVLIPGESVGTISITEIDKGKE
jgi:hypothetical protein